MPIEGPMPSMESQHEAVDIEEIEENEFSSEKVKAETNEVTEAVFGELLRDKVYDFVEHVQKNPDNAGGMSLVINSEDVKKLIKMHRDGTLPNWSGSKQEEYIEELEDLAGMES